MLTWNTATKSSCLKPGPQAPKVINASRGKDSPGRSCLYQLHFRQPLQLAVGTETRREGNPSLCRDITAAVADVKRPWQLRDCLMWMEALSIQHVPNEGDGHARVPQMLYQRELEILQTLLILPQDTKWKAPCCKMEITLLIPPGWGRREILHKRFKSHNHGPAMDYHAPEAGIRWPLQGGITTITCNKRNSSLLHPPNSAFLPSLTLLTCLSPQNNNIVGTGWK